MADLRIYPDRPTAARALAGMIANIAQSAAAVRDHFTIALAGGSTPRTAYRLLADEFAADIDWMSTYVFWGDERCVPWDHAESNVRMAREAMLNHVPLALDRLYRIPVQLTPEAAAQAYQAELVRFFETRGRVPRFDVMLLGMGADGHIASLFPGSAALEETQKWVVHTTAEGATVPDRVTVTLPVINAASNVIIYTLGAEKADAIAQIFLGGDQPVLPAGRVQPRDGRLTWIIDEAAATKLRASTQQDSFTLI